MASKRRKGSKGNAAPAGESDEGDSSPTRVKSSTRIADLLKLVPQLADVGYDK